MIKRVYGKVDGTEIVMQQSGDRWEVPVPFSADGEYVVEIMAEDEAGNNSYVTRILFVVNGSLIKNYVIPTPYLAMLLIEREAYLLEDQFIGCLQRYYAEYYVNSYVAELTEGA